MIAPKIIKLVKNFIIASYYSNILRYLVSVEKEVKIGKIIFLLR
jgi:hypothetical protein